MTKTVWHCHSDRQPHGTEQSPETNHMFTVTWLLTKLTLEEGGERKTSVNAAGSIDVTPVTCHRLKPVPGRLLTKVKVQQWSFQKMLQIEIP